MNGTNKQLEAFRQLCREEYAEELRKNEPFAWIWRWKDEDVEDENNGWRLSIGEDCPSYREECETKPLYAEPMPPREQQVPDWAECERISDISEVDEALRNFNEDATQDNATGLIRVILLAAAPKAEQATIEDRLKEGRI